MTLFGILSSPSQRRSFLLATGLVLAISVVAIFAIAYKAPDTRNWNVLIGLLTSIVASGVFAIVAGLYISYFFIDPNDLPGKTVLLPEDIGKALKDIAEQATSYKIYVRTGRHFRADILPRLVKRARDNRHPIQIEVILLDFRDDKVCQRYVDYRKASSFDQQLWDKDYVKKEVLATILALTKTSREYGGLVDIQLYLSKRLSIFRIEGSSDELLVTREDPKDTASRYSRSHRDFPAFVAEFRWVRDESDRVEKDDTGGLPTSLEEMFGGDNEIAKLQHLAEKAVNSPSPYVR
jgi:hypothetical protein